MYNSLSFDYITIYLSPLQIISVCACVCMYVYVYVCICVYIYFG